jgi:hypothetical protein
LNIPDAQNTKIVGVNKNSSFGTPTHKASILYYIAQQKKKKKKKVWRYNETSKATRGMQVYDFKFIFGEKKKKKKTVWITESDC